jgi:exodeoxyribonuclease VII small subunit
MSASKLNFEESIKKLEKIVEELEAGEHTLDDALAKFEAGIKLGNSCKEILEKAENRVKMLIEDEDGEISETEAPDEF